MRTGSIKYNISVLWIWVFNATFNIISIIFDHINDVMESVLTSSVVDHGAD